MTAFISRDLTPHSAFRALLEPRGWVVNGESLVQLTPLAFPEVPAADWIFFSSRNAVAFFFRQLERQALPRPAVQWAAIGRATAEALTAWVGKIDFCGAGDPETTAASFGRLAAGQRVVFPGARHSRQSIPLLLTGTIESVMFEIYDNIPSPNPIRRDEAVLAFTSPMNAQAYFAHHLLQPHQRLLAIGATTATTLHDLGFPHVSIAKEPSEAGLAAAALKLPV